MARYSSPSAIQINTQAESGDFYLGTSIPMTGLSQLSKSASFVGSPVTLRALIRTLYWPFGIVDPLANVGVLSANSLNPVPSYVSIENLAIRMSDGRCAGETYVLVRVPRQEVELEQRAERRYLARRSFRARTLHKAALVPLVERRGDLD